MGPPALRFSQERFLEVDAEARREHGGTEATLRLIRRFVEHNGVRFRSTEMDIAGRRLALTMRSVSGSVWMLSGVDK
jgi:hypothetical protein